MGDTRKVFHDCNCILPAALREAQGTGI